MTQAILVTSIRLEAISGPTCYAGENGFSSVSGRLSTDDPKIAAALDRHVLSGELVTVRCGLLEVAGLLQHQATVEAAQQYVVRIQTVSYGPPEPTGNGA